LPHDIECTHQIHIDNPLKLFDVERPTFAKHLPGVRNPCGVDAHVDPAERRCDFDDRRGDRGTIGHIHRHRDRWYAGLFGY